MKTNKVKHYLATAVSSGCVVGAADAAVIELNFFGVPDPNVLGPAFANGGATTDFYGNTVSGYRNVVYGYNVDTSLYTAVFYTRKDDSLSNKLTTGISTFPSGRLPDYIDFVSGIAVDDFGNANPRAFSKGETIDGDSGILFGTQASTTSFKSNTSIEASEWTRGSYLGFVTDDGRYGYLDVTWDPTTEDFYIYGGRLETTPGVGIVARAVPEPTGIAMFALGSAGLFAHRRRKKAA